MNLSRIGEPPAGSPFFKTMNERILGAGGLTREEVKVARGHLHKTNKLFGEHFVSIPVHQWPIDLRGGSIGRTAVWRNRHFLAQVFETATGTRISVNRTWIDKDGAWEDGITWDELMNIKNAIGFTFAWAVELFPPHHAVVNVANLRHLWILKEAPEFAWKTPKKL